MLATAEGMNIEIKHPVNFGSKEFIARKYDYYQWLLREAPVYKGKVSVLSAYFLSRYDDCVAMLKDPRFVRNRTTATGGRRLPFPVPKSVEGERWYGWRPMTPDSVPIIDRLPGNEHVVVAAGHGMLGVSMAPSSGKMAAALVCDMEPPVDPEPYRLARFG